jgi:acetyl-CoA carboxylase biotin carboxyl carrier protein
VGVEANTNPRAISSSQTLVRCGKGECNGAFQSCQLWTGGVLGPWVQVTPTVWDIVANSRLTPEPQPLCERPLSFRCAGHRPGEPGLFYSDRMATEVQAHITGTVWPLLVKPGDTVTQDQTLVILESMKMEMPLEAPEAGRVVSVAVSEGASVEEGELLLTLESV